MTIDWKSCDCVGPRRGSAQFEGVTGAAGQLDPYGLVYINGVDAVFTAHPGCTEAAEGDLRCDYPVSIDPNGPRLSYHPQQLLVKAGELVWILAVRWPANYSCTSSNLRRVQSEDKP